MRDLSFLKNPSMEWRDWKDQQIMLALWENIKCHPDIQFGDEMLEDVANAGFCTIGARTQWYGRTISHDAQLAKNVAAFNIMQGYFDLHFHNEEHYANFMNTINERGK